nr:type II 3-dehydroquinate dehydratase [Lachnospiraceae bacterium]
LGASSVTVVSRSGKRYDSDVSSEVRFITYDILKEELTNRDKNNGCILVNTTPAGMFPDISGMPVDPSLLDSPMIMGVLDVVYNPLRTRLVLEAEKRGIRAANGLSMLVAQAFFAEKLFFGRDPVMDEEEEKVLDRIIGSLRAEKENQVLIGMPGSGKSFSGRWLSEETGRPLFDTDEIFLERYGIPAGEYIGRNGEAAFREKEAEIIAELSSKEGIVISTGGGAILNSKNTDALKANGILIYIHRPLKELETDGRPLSKGRENLKGLFYRRLPLYLRAKDRIILNCGSKEELKEKLSALRNKRERGEEGEEPMKILIINGPNLNMLGIREPEIYGRSTYADLLEYLSNEAKTLGVEAEFFQSNHEGDLVDAIQDAYGIYDGIVINPGAYTHTSIALPDAVKAVGIPTVEVHISDVDSREEFRKTSYIRQAAIGTVSGKGFEGYAEAMRLIMENAGKA